MVNDTRTNRKRLGIFGGTFDPPHRGHLAIALAAVKQLKLERLYFVPARIAPHKQGRRATAAIHRVAMIRLLLRHHPAFRLSLADVRRNDVSFTIDTLRTFRKRFPSAAFILIIGEDNLRTFHHWKSPGEIRRLARLAVYPRRSTRGVRRGSAGALDVLILSGRFVDISSTGVREAGADARRRAQVSPAVASYIKRHRLYARERQRTLNS